MSGYVAERKRIGKVTAVGTNEVRTADYEVGCWKSAKRVAIGHVGAVSERGNYLRRRTERTAELLLLLLDLGLIDLGSFFLVFFLARAERADLGVASRSGITIESPAAAASRASRAAMTSSREGTHSFLSNDSRRFWMLS